MIVEKIKKEKILNYIGILFIVLGLIFNEYLLVLLTKDGVVAEHSKYVIRLFNGLSISLGLLIILSTSFKKLIDTLVFKYISTEIKLTRSDCNYFIRIALTGLLTVLLFTQMSYMVSAIYQNQDKLAIVYATDPDAGKGIWTAMNADIFSGGSFGHGVLYQRIAYYLSQFSPIFEESISQSENYEKRIHFTLQLISLFSIYLFAFLLAHILVNQFIDKLLATLLISSTLFDNHIWTEYFLRVHPDMLLACLSALVLYFASKYMSNNQKNYKYLLLTSFVAGAALSTKLIFLLFLPGLLFLEIPRININYIIRILLIYIAIIFSYIIIAFPQSLIIDQFSWLKNQSTNYQRLPNLESFHEWWALLINQIWLPLIMITLLSIFFGKDRSPGIHQEKYYFLRIWIIALIPFLLLLTRRVISPHDWYTLPFASILLTAFAISMYSILNKHVAKYTKWIKTDFKKYFFTVVFLVCFQLMIGITPKNVDKVLLKDVMYGRQDVTETYGIINKHLEDGNKILADWGVPFNRKKFLGSYFGKSELIKLGLPTYDDLSDFDIMAFNTRTWASVFLKDEVPEWYGADYPKWKEHREIYLMFHNRGIVTDKFNQTWVKNYDYDYDNEYGYEIWVKK